MIFLIFLIDFIVLAILIKRSVFYATILSSAFLTNNLVKSSIAF